MIRYLNHSIDEHTNIISGDKVFCLSHWYVSDEAPNIAGRRPQGYFKSHQEAEDHHNKMLVGRMENIK